MLSLALENSFGKGRAIGRIFEMQLGDTAGTLISAPPFRVSGWNRGREESLAREALVLEGGSLGEGGGGFGFGLRALPYHFGR